MGGALDKDSEVTKDQVLSACADAFDAVPRGGTVKIEDIVKAGAAASENNPTRLDRWKTTSSYMSITGLQPYHLHKPSPRPMGRYATQNDPAQKPTALQATGRVLAGAAQQGSAGGGISWQAAIASGPITRDERMGKIRNMFGALDLDNNHIVTEGEFVEAMAAEGITVGEAKLLFKQMDDARMGRLTLAKFDHYVAVHTLAIVRSSFKSLDAKHDRQIKRKEFAMYFLGNGLSRHQVSRLWDDIDKNGNGKVNFVEFRDWALETLETTSLDQVAANLGLSIGSSIGT